MTIPQELASIRKSIEKENVSYSELARLAELIPHIPHDDILLRQWAGLPENMKGAILRELASTRAKTCDNCGSTEGRNNSSGTFLCDNCGHEEED